MKIQFVSFFFFILCLSFSAFAQKPGVDTATKNVEILDARRLSFKKVNDTSSLQILAGQVKLRQGTALFYCDSCIINNASKVFEAFGNVHINDSDTAHI